MLLFASSGSTHCFLFASSESGEPKRRNRSRSEEAKRRQRGINEEAKRSFRGEPVIRHRFYAEPSHLLSKPVPEFELLPRRKCISSQL